MNITREQAQSIVADFQTRGVSVDESLIYEVAVNIDEDAMIQAEMDRLSTSLWDKTSPINGVDATEVLSGRDDIPEGGEVYLICRGGQVIYFQPFDPYQDGFVPITQLTWEDVSGRHKEDVVRSSVSGWNELLRQVHLRVIEKSR